MAQSDRLEPPRVASTRGLYASFPGGVAGVRDLSVRGAMLEDRDPLPIGSRIRLTLHLGAENVRCVALVAHSIAEEGMVVEFVDMSPDDRRRLLEYITEVAAAASRARPAAGRGDGARRRSTGSASAASTRASNPSGPLPRLAELLVRRGAATAERLAAATAEHRRRGGRFSTVLLELGVVSDMALATCFNEEYRIPLIDLTTVDPTPEALRLVPYEVARRHEILPIGATPSTLTVATSDPSNLDGRDEVKIRSGRDLTVAVAPSRPLQEAIHYFYHERVRDAG